MADPTSFDLERLEHVRHIVNAMYDALVGKGISAVKALPDVCRQSGEDSSLKDVWEEFKYQVQREPSVMFNLYEDLILDICASVVASLDREQQRLLWLWSDAYYDLNNEGDRIPCDGQVNKDVAKELYDRLCSAASHEELAIDPDIERDRSYEEDMRLFKMPGKSNENNPDMDTADGNSSSVPDD